MIQPSEGEKADGEEDDDFNFEGAAIVMQDKSDRSGEKSKFSSNN